MDANRNTVIDYAVVASSAENDPAPAKASEARTSFSLAALLVALVLALLLIALLAQPASGT